MRKKNSFVIMFVSIRSTEITKIKMINSFIKIGKDNKFKINVKKGSLK